MTELQQKINLVRQYIFDRKRIDIGTVKFTGVTHDRELGMLNFAYGKALEYYRSR